MPKKPKVEEPGKEVVNWEEKMRDEARAVAKTERPSVNKISFQAGVMTYMDNAVPDNMLDGIIVANVWENVFYREKYKAGVVKPPECFALGVPEGDKEPLMQAHRKVPEREYGPNCGGCDMFKWGSDLEGGRGKACGERRRLAFIPRPETEKEALESELAVISVPVMSVKNWANYVNKLSAMYQRPVWGVVTRVAVVPDKKAQFKVTFEFVEKVEPEHLAAVNSRIELATQTLLVPYEMNPVENKEETKENTKY